MAHIRTLFRSRRFATLLSVALLVVLVGILALNLAPLGNRAYAAANAYPIALATSLTGDSSPTGRTIQVGLQLYIDRLNAAGGINGHAIDLLAFDDRSAPTAAPQIAQQIADSRALAVIGHYSSAVSVAAAPTYKQNAIPVISGTATADALTQDNPFSYRTIYNVSTAATQMATYIDTQLAMKRVTIIAANDALGTNILSSFGKAYPDVIVKSWLYDDAPDRRVASRTQILDELSRTADPGIVVLGMLELPGSSFIIDMRRRGMHYPIFGGAPSFAGPTFRAFFTNEPEEKSQPGFFTEGVYAHSDFILASANSESQTFAQALRQRTGLELTFPIASTIDALKITLAAIATAPIGDTAPSKGADRLAIQEALEGFKSPQNAVNGLTGPLYFDSQNTSPSPVEVGYFTGVHFIPAPVQYAAAVNVPDTDLQDQKTAGNIVELHGQPVWKQQIVYTGISINQITRVDTSANSSFFADFYLWLRYAGDEAEVLSFDFPDATSGDLFKATQPDAAKTINGLNYRRYHIRGEFKAAFDFHDFPFDQQYLTLQFSNIKTPRERVVYVVDQVGLDPGNNNTTQQLQRLRQSLSSWYLSGLVNGSDSVESNSKNGDLSIEGSYATTAYSGFHTTMVLRRNVLAFAIKNLLPLALIVLILYVTLFFSVALTAERLTIAVTAMLTSAVLLAAVGSQLTDASYTVAIEYLFYAFFALCFLCLLMGVIREQFHAHNRERIAKRIDRIAIIVYPLIILAIIAVYVAHYAAFFTSAPMTGV